MENDKGKESVLEEGISSSKICEMLTHLSQRIDSLETCASNIEAIAVKLPGVMSATTDAIDEFCSNTARRGVDIDERLRNGLHLLVQLTEPKTMHALSLLLAKIDTLGPLLQTLESLPDTVSVVVDSFDEICKNAGRSGIDIESFIKQASDTALKLNELFKSDEFKALMDSGILNPKAVYMVGQAGCALAHCTDDKPRRVGLVGLLKALWNRDIQQAVGFLIRFGKRFGHLLDTMKS